MEKTYDPKEVEKTWYAHWERNGYFASELDSKKEPYSLLMPPPNLTGQPHIGHTLQHTLLDIIARFKRMQGYDVLLLPGVDHAGIQFQGTLERILEKEGTAREKLGHEKFLERAWRFKEEVYNTYHDVWKVTGISADWSREVFTLDEKPSHAVFEAFKRFFEEGRMYKGAYLVQWCPRCKTAIENVEMEYEEKTETLYFVRYAIAGNGSFITIATARPETIYADSAVAIYPNHPMFHKFAGQSALNPLTQTLLPIIVDKRVDKEFGTGALKITPGHDPLDFEIGMDHHLPILHAVNKEGMMTELAHDVAGLPTRKARAKVVQKLQSLGAIEKTESYRHAVPICERCKSIVEPLISEEYFIKMKELADSAIAVIRSGMIAFAPKTYEPILTDWLKSVRDWCISRDLWWGHRIPVWFCRVCNPGHTLDANGVALFEKTPNAPCKACGTRVWERETKVLDTWFSSGLWPFSTLGWPDKNPGFVRYYPWDFEISGGEIKYLWIARMIMLAKHFTNTIPWKHMYFHGMMRDLKGRKFSKSLGNGVDPLALINQYGADATRMALATYAVPGRDQRMSPQTAALRTRGYRNFGNKLWNIARYTLASDVPHMKGKPKKRHPVHSDDKAILAALAATIRSVTASLDCFRFEQATKALYNFTWRDLADTYIEKSKARRVEAQPMILFVLNATVRLLHPFMPFITEEIWQRLPHKPTPSIMIAPWPKEGDS